MSRESQITATVLSVFSLVAIATAGWVVGPSTVIVRSDAYLGLAPNNGWCITKELVGNLHRGRIHVIYTQALSGGRTQVYVRHAEWPYTSWPAPFQVSSNTGDARDGGHLVPGGQRCHSILRLLVERGTPPDGVPSDAKWRRRLVRPAHIV